MLHSKLLHSTRGYIAAIFFAISASVTFSALLPNTVNAVLKYSDLNVAGKATAYEYSRIMEQCFASGKKNLKISEVEGGAVFGDRTGKRDAVRIYNNAIISEAAKEDGGFADDVKQVWLRTNIITGPYTWGNDLLTATSGKTTLRGCEESVIWKSFFNFYNMKPSDLVCWKGAPYRVSKGICKETTVSSYELPKYNNQNLGQNGDNSSDWRKWFKSAMKDLTGFDWDNASNGVRHEVWLNELMYGCQVKLVSLEAYNATEDKYRYSYKSIDDTGKETTMYIIGEKDKNHTYGDDGKTCGKALDKMNEYSAAYVKELQLDFKNNKTDLDSIEDEATTTCGIPGVGWIVCPIISFMGNITDSLYGIIQNLLTIKPSLVSTTSPTNTGWNSMRSIANVGLVLVFLIIIFSQLTSFGLSNYGIKKVLPRLIIAAILVNISFIVCQLAIDLSNILGSSIKSLIDSIPVFSTSAAGFWSQGNGLSEVIVLILAGTSGTVGAVAITAVSVGSILYFGGVGLLLMIILAGVIAVAVTFLIIAARMALAVILVVVSPIAFLAMVLPNTRNLYEKWQKMFVAVLAIYPMLALVFGLSQMASNIIIQSSTTAKDVSEGLMVFIIGIGVALIPLFASIPMLKGSLNAVPGIGKFAQKLAGAKPFKGSISKGMEGVRTNAANAGRGAALSGKFGGKAQKFAAGRARRNQRNQERASNIQRAETELVAQSILNDPNASDRAKAAALGAQKRLEDEEISNIMTLDKSRNMSPDDHLSRIHDSNSSDAEKLASISAIEKEGGQAMVNKMLASSNESLPLSARQAMGAVAASKSQNNPAFGGSAIKDITSGNFNASQAYTNYAAGSEFNAQRLLEMHGSARTEMLNALSGIDSDGNAIPNFKPNEAAIEALRNATLQIDSNPDMKGKISAQARADIDKALARAKATSGVTSQPQPAAAPGAPAPIVNRRPVQETMSDLPTPLVPPSRDAEGSLDIPRSPDS